MEYGKGNLQNIGYFSFLDLQRRPVSYARHTMSFRAFRTHKYRRPNAHSQSHQGTGEWKWQKKGLIMYEVIRKTNMLEVSISRISFLGTKNITPVCFPNSPTSETSLKNGSHASPNALSEAILSSMKYSICNVRNISHKRAQVEQYSHLWRAVNTGDLLHCLVADNETGKLASP